MPLPKDLFAQIEGGGGAKIGGKKKKKKDENNPLAQMFAARQAAAAAPEGSPTEKKVEATDNDATLPDGVLYQYDESKNSFVFSFENVFPRITTTNTETKQNVIVVPLTPCVYRMTDYTMGKKEPISVRACVLKLGVLRCLQRECKTLNILLQNRFKMASSEDDDVPTPSLEEDELGKTRFMELLSNCGVYQKVSELVLQVAGQTHHDLREKKENVSIPQVDVEQLNEFLEKLEELVPDLEKARKEIDETQSVSFYPGLGEFFTPGSKVLCFPDGMEGNPLGCTVVQSWYVEEEVSSSVSSRQQAQQQPKKIKRRFVMCIEYIISVGDALVFVAATDVYPEFPNLNRNMPLRELTHRKLSEEKEEDMLLLKKLQSRGEFYASISTGNHFLEYYPNSFYPIITGSWNQNAIRPLSKGGRVMVDVQRGILENHLPVRTNDGMSDTVKEAIKLWDQSKRTGVAVPFRTCRLVLSSKLKLQTNAEDSDADRIHLWQSWPMVTGFSFSSRVWGKLLLGMPKTATNTGGRCGNCGYINFQDQAFEQLVLDEDKKELIRAVARNAGGRNDEDDSDDDDDDDFALDVVANKGAASIFLLHGPPGCGKTLTAEAIAELLKKPLYIVTAGDLGISADQVEKSLGTVLELCQTWDALVLIDEADVFLEARSSTEIQRNALVCVMLRLLEYYSGCLFLSSNRDASTIDAAIASRITVMLGYPPLDATGRGKVWKNLIELVPPLEEGKKNPSKYRLEFTSEDYQTLAEQYGLNGRQIKNSIILARALARERRKPLSLPLLQRAVTAVAGEQPLPLNKTS